MAYFVSEALEKSLEGELYLKSNGKTIDEKNAQVHDSDKWRDFQSNLAKKRADYREAKRLLDLKIKAYESEYLTLKIEAEAIRKHP